MFRVVNFIVIALLITFVNGTEVKKCKKDLPFPLSVEIEGCNTPPCDVIKGSTAVMNVHFVGIKEETNKLTTKVRATTLGITVPYELPDDVANVCTNLLYGANCPIYATEDVIYKFNFFIDSYYPEIGVKVEVSLVDEDDEVVSCFTVDVKVKKGVVAPKQFDVPAN